MKIQAILHITVFCCCSLVAAGQFTFGIQAGKTKSWGSSYKNADYGKPIKLDGFNASVQLYYRLGKHFQVGIEPGTSRRGYADRSALLIYTGVSEPASVSSSVYLSSIDLNYLSLPIVAIFDTPVLGKKFGIFIKSGIGPSWLVSGHSLGNPPELVFTGLIDFGSFPGRRRWDIGLYSGAGIAWTTAKGRLLFSAENYHGFLSTWGYGFSKSRMLGIALGYSIDL